MLNQENHSIYFFKPLPGNIQAIMYVSYEMLTISLVLKIKFSSVLYLVAYQHQLAQDHEFLL